MPGTSGQIVMQQSNLSLILAGPGQRVRLRFAHNLVTTGADCRVRLVRDGPEAWVDVPSNTVGGVFDFTFTSLYGGANVFQLRNFAAGTTVTGDITDALVQVLGPVAVLEPDPNYGLRDRSNNSLHASWLAGISYLGTRFDSMTAWRVAHGGATNLQFNNGPCIDTTKSWVIDSLLVHSTAAVTWSLGNASAGAQYVNGFSLAAGANYIPHASLVTRVISGSVFWSASNGAATITLIPILRRIP